MISLGITLEISLRIISGTTLGINLGIALGISSRTTFFSCKVQGVLEFSDLI